MTVCVGSTLRENEARAVLCFECEMSPMGSCVWMFDSQWLYYFGRSGTFKTWSLAGVSILLGGGGGEAWRVDSQALLSIHPGLPDSRDNMISHLPCLLHSKELCQLTL